MQNFISIPTPCHENWDNMTTQEQGRHCAKCNIVVKDFTSMSNEEILNYLQKNTGHVCGRVREEQLPITPNLLSDKLKKFVYALALIFLPFIPINSFSQDKAITETNAISNTGGIDGTIFNQKGQTIPFALIIASQDGVQKGAAKTDLNGNFKIKPLEAGTYKLEITQLGYNKLEVTPILIKSETILTMDFTINRIKSGKMLGVIRMGGMHRQLIDEYQPNSQKMSGEEIQNLFGGRK